MQKIPQLDPRRDIVFKSIFGKTTEKASFARNSLISAFLGKPVTESTVLNPELIPYDIRDKATRLDILCMLDDGSQVNLEMQMCNTGDSIKERLCYYCSQLFVSQKSRGIWYEDLNPVYVILISNEKLFPQEEKSLSLVQYRFESGELFSDKLNIMTLDLSKLNDTTKFEEELDAIKRWGLYFNSATDDSRKELIKALLEKDEGIRMADKVFYEVTQDDYERAKIFEREKILMDYYSGLAEAKQKGLKKGLEEGLEQGLKKGKAEGLEEGKAEGLAEGAQNEKAKIAQTLKAKGFSAKDIEEITGLKEGSY